MNSQYDIAFEKGLVETGDDSYIRAVMKKAERGESITVGFLGGSITQDAVTTEHRFCYAYRVYEWFRNNFPKSKIDYVNVGIGATDSEFAAARVGEHLLRFNPDFILMEHAVNDGCTEHFKETYEGVVRQILKANPDQALLHMCNVFYNDGSSAELMHRRVSRHYSIPVLSMRTTIYDALLSGKFDNRKITHDDLHPNDDGHALVAGVITTYLDSVLEKSKSDPADFTPEKRNIPDPLTLNRYEKSVKYDNRNSERVIKAISGFSADNTPQERVKDCFRFGYIGRKKGSFVEYEVEGSCIAVQFCRTIKLPAPVACVTIDNNPDTKIILDANFDETWGDKLELTDIYISEKSNTHTVRIEITEDHPDDNGDFYLASVIVSG